MCNKYFNIYYEVIDEELYLIPCQAPYADHP